MEIPDNIRNEKGLSNFDVRHNAIINALYELPFGKSLRGVGRQLFSGWQIGGIGTFAAGVPFTVENSANRSQNQATGSNFSDRPNLVTGASNNPTHGVSAGCTFGTGTSAITVAAGTPVGTPSHWFDPCALLTNDARSEYRPEFRERQPGGGWQLKGCGVRKDTA